MSSIEKFRDAYLLMAHKANYRPAAPGDGFGGIYLNADQLADPEMLEKEARKYALVFAREEDDRGFFIGVSDYETSQAFVYTIEAARCLCGGIDFRELAGKLLMMALEEMNRIKEEER